MAIKSRTAVPLALLMLAVALAFCGVAQGEFALGRYVVRAAALPSPSLLPRRLP
jgi:hypothetical protein